MCIHPNINKRLSVISAKKASGRKEREERTKRASKPILARMERRGTIKAAKWKNPVKEKFSLFFFLSAS